MHENIIGLFMVAKKYEPTWMMYEVNLFGTAAMIRGKLDISDLCLNICVCEALYEHQEQNWIY